MTRKNGGTAFGLGNESGQTIILLALSLVVLCGFLGLAIDVGQARATKIKLQEAADAAALAGALEVAQCNGSSNCSEMQTAAQTALAENGLTGSTLQAQVCSISTASSLTLTLNNGPCALGSTDPNYNNTRYVEAVVEEPQPTIFARILGVSTMNLSAHAESMGNPLGCFYNLGGPGQGKGLVLNSGSRIDATNCGIYDNGDLTTENGSGETSLFLSYAGANPVSGGSLSPAPTKGASVKDPVNTSNFPALPTGSCTNVTSGTTSLGPGYYCGITISSGTRLTLTGGTYYLSGNFTPMPGSRVDGTAGVTLVFITGSFQNSSGSRVDLIAPSTGSYPGFAIVQVASDITPMIFDSGNQGTFQGIFYAPGAEVDINSGNRTNDNFLVVAYSTVVNSGARLNITQDWSWLPGGVPIKTPSVLSE